MAKISAFFPGKIYRMSWGLHITRVSPHLCIICVHPRTEPPAPPVTPLLHPVAPLIVKHPFTTLSQWYTPLTPYLVTPHYNLSYLHYTLVPVKSSDNSVTPPLHSRYTLFHPRYTLLHPVTPYYIHVKPRPGHRIQIISSVLLLLHKIIDYLVHKPGRHVNVKCTWWSIKLFPRTFLLLFTTQEKKTASSFQFPPLFFSTGTFYFWLPALGERHASDFVKVGEKEERIGNLSPPPSSTPTNSAHLSLLVCEALLLLLLPFDVMAN